MKNLSKKKAKASIGDVHEYTAAQKQVELEKQVDAMKDDDLFYDDTVGNTQSRKNRKTKTFVDLTPVDFEVKKAAFVPKVRGPKPFKCNLKLKQRERNIRKRIGKQSKEMKEVEESEEEEDEEMEDEDEDEELDSETEQMINEDLQTLIELEQEEDEDEDGEMDEETLQYLLENGYFEGEGEEGDDMFDYEDELMLYEPDGEEEIHLVTTERRAINPNTILKSLYTGKHIDSTFVNTRDDYDPWDDEEDQALGEAHIKDKRYVSEFYNNAEFLDESIANNQLWKRNEKHNAHVIKRGTVVVPSGLSVNPSKEDLEAIVQVAARRAQREDEMEQKKMKVLLGKNKVPTVPDLSEQELQRVQKNYVPVVVGKKEVLYRSRQQMNKIKRAKQAGYEANRKRHQDKYNQQFENIDKIIAKLDKRDAYNAKKKEERDYKRSIMGQQTIKRMGNQTYKAAFPEVYTSDQLNGGDLRTAIQSTNLIGDVFHDMQTKNKIAVTSKKFPKQAWRKTKVKRDMNYTPLDVNEVVKRVEAEALKRKKEFAPTKNTKLKRKRGESDQDKDMDLW